MNTSALHTTTTPTSSSSISRCDSWSLQQQQRIPCPVWVLQSWWQTSQVLEQHTSTKWVQPTASQQLPSHSR